LFEKINILTFNSTGQNMNVTTRMLAIAASLVLALSGAKANNRPLDLPVCSLADISAATACSGYFAGNLNGGSSDKVADSQLALAAIGFNWDGVTIVQKIESFSGQAIAFSQPLIGTSFISVHYGAGQGPAKVPGGTTGFYKLENAVSQSSFATLFGSLSNAILYANVAPTGGVGNGPGGGNGGGNIGSETGIGGTGGGTGAIPEPATWMQLIAGFGLIGLARRSRRRVRAV
jgi:hypothetical protein